MQPTNNNGSIIIRFTKFGYKYSLTNLGRFDDSWSMATARNICAALQSDIDIGRFSARGNDDLFTAYHPLAKLSSHHETHSKAVDCLQMVETKLSSKALRDRNLHQTANFLRRYAKPIKSSDDALKFWQWLQGESKGNERTINRHLTSLKPVCLYFTDIPKLKEPSIKDDRPFSKSEIKQIIDVFDKEFSHYSPFVKFLFSTGCRPNEATALRWSDVNFEAKTITIHESIGIANDGSKVRKETKTGVYRTFPINQKLIDILCDLKYKQSYLSDLVFPSPNSNLIDIRTFRSRVWVKALELAKVPYRKPYNTRHTFCSHFLNETPDFVKLASITHGTKSGVETLIKHYAHIVDKPVMPDMF